MTINDLIEKDHLKNYDELFKLLGEFSRLYASFKFKFLNSLEFG